MMDYPLHKVQVYVRLLNEGTEVFRPTQAVEIGKGLFELMATPHYDSEDEAWEFLPGAIVRIEMRHGASGSFPLAVEP
jgi:hypothetical protein